MRKAVFYTTNCTHKIAEARGPLDGRGAPLIQVSYSAGLKPSPAKIEEQYPKIFAENDVILMLEESTTVVRDGAPIDIYQAPEYQEVQHQSELKIQVSKKTFNKEANQTTKEEFSDTIICTTNGYIRRPRGRVDGHIFDWDHLFVVKSRGESYHELRMKGQKISARDKAIAQFLRKYFTYKVRINLKFNSLAVDKIIHFDVQPLSAMYLKVMQDYPKITLYGMDKIFRTVFAEGMYYHSPVNRRGKLNWGPIFNPAPVVRKPNDPIQELTYAVHDIGHFVFRPDVLFIGIPKPLHKKIYFIMRMMSEAITLVFADMMFVMGILDSGGEYKTKDQRKIYPLFSKIMEHNPMTLPDSKEQIPDYLVSYFKPIWRANVHYCILGDKSMYFKLLGGQSCKEFEKFDKKYSQFMIQDGRWTMKNYDEMAKDSELHAKWWATIKGIASDFDLGVMTTETIADSQSKYKLGHMQNAELVDTLFEFTYASNILPVFHRTYFPKEASGVKLVNNKTKAFMRYLCNQIFIFVRYQKVPGSKECLQQILQYVAYIKESRADVTDENIETIRGWIREFLETCAKNDYITEDDLVTYMYLYSIVDPFIIDYDSEYKCSLEEVAGDFMRDDYARHF